MLFKRLVHVCEEQANSSLNMLQRSDTSFHFDVVGKIFSEVNLRTIMEAAIQDQAVYSMMILSYFVLF